MVRPNGKSALVVIFLVAGFLSWGLPASAALQEEVSISSGEGKINWEEGYVYATAVASADMAEMVNEVQAEQVAKKTARYEAYVALNETVNKVRIDAKTILHKAMMTDDGVKIETQGELQNASVYVQSFSWTPKGTPRAEVVVRMPIYGGLTRATAGWASRRGKSQERLPSYSDTVSATPAADQNKQPFSGLIVDARGSGARPALQPRLLTKDGSREVYSPRNIDLEHLRRYGAVGYTSTLEKARANARVGDNPLIVKAQRAMGPGDCDLLVSEEEAKKIILADTQSNFLTNCRVVVVLP